MLRRVLIANRGEIAIRLARAARDEGIVPLGIFSEADRNARHLRAMDDALEIGAAPASASYLNAERILEAARALDADAIHPGYGFLSERAEFARSVCDAELIFVGPTPAALAATGDKGEAKRRARGIGVPVLPGYDGENQSAAHVCREAASLGVPLLIKAIAGGGGRGMRVVSDLATFDDELIAARREARAAFGDERVLLERFVERPRHVEVQVLADAYGRTLVVGERECSIQRRHQKIVEEAPSPSVDAALRARLSEAATSFARAIEYRNAGTVEFLLDGDAFFFIEMNARLQVEHPVSELAFGVDLARWQYRIARGAALDDAHLAPRAWAIEARLCAEDAAHDFVPSSGTIARWTMPSDAGTRVDAGYDRGDEVSVHYDSLLAKIVAAGQTRDDAIVALRRALGQTEVSGIRTNLETLRAIAAHPAFASGATTTAFLEEHGRDLRASTQRREGDALLLAVAALVDDPRTWRLGSVGRPIALQRDGRRFDLRANRTADGWRIDGDLNGALIVDVATERTTATLGVRRVSGTVTIDESSVTVEIDGNRRRFEAGGSPRRGGDRRRGTARA